MLLCYFKVCLKHYDYNPEAVINAILEDNLPPHLNECQIPDILTLPETFAYEEPTDISKRNRTKYLIKMQKINVIIITVKLEIQDCSFQ